VALTAATVTTGGAVLSLANPEGVDLIVTRLILDITTQSTGAATVDAGIAADGTTSSDTLIDGKSVAAAGVFDNIEDQGTNGKSAVKWGASEYLTITASATLAGLVGNAYIDYIRE
jgi:hypothetical protein